MITCKVTKSLLVFLGCEKGLVCFELHSFHMSDCPGMTGTCPIKLNDVLTLRQSNFEMLS